MKSKGSWLNSCLESTSIIIKRSCLLPGRSLFAPVHIRSARIVNNLQNATYWTRPDDQELQPRKLLRALLRECTYLPDPFTRRWLTSHVMKRFRKYHPRKGQRPNDPKLGKQRVRQKLKEAEKSLRTLRRANQGERDQLLETMLMAYGRTGKRKYELIKELQLPQGSKVALTSSNTGGDEADQKAVAQLLTPQLRALLISQSKQQPPRMEGKHPQQLEPNIPLLNVWLRAMPQKRTNNAILKHYKFLLERLLPPLPDEEWDRLRRLASGEAALPEPVKSRTVLEPRQSSALEVVVGKRQPPREIYDNREAHNVTPRFLRRLYCQVFSLCPKMDFDTSKNEWLVSWGHHALQYGGASADVEDDKVTGSSRD